MFPKNGRLETASGMAVVSAPAEGSTYGRPGHADPACEVIAVFDGRLDGANYFAGRHVDQTRAVEHCVLHMVRGQFAMVMGGQRLRIDEGQATEPKTICLRGSRGYAMHQPQQQ